MSLIDVDGSVPWSSERTEVEMLQQLEIIFLNFERHPFYSQIFEMAAGEPKLKVGLRCSKNVLAA